MMDLIYMLAAGTAAAPDHMIPGAWVLEMIAKIFAGLGVFGAALYAAYRKGDANARAKGSVTIEGQPIEFKPTSPVVSWNDHSSLATRVTRVENQMEVMKDEQGRRHVELLNSGHERELRITETLTDKLDVVATRLHERMDMEFGKPSKPPGRR